MLDLSAHGPHPRENRTWESALTQKIIQPCLWHGLGLGAALGLAAAPAAALAPSADRVPDALLWPVQAESGEAGESG